jgi:hypothetical protein
MALLLLFALKARAPVALLGGAGFFIPSEISVGP